MFLADQLKAVSLPGPIIYCRRCGYSLQGLTSERCPERGTRFDLCDPLSFSTTPPKRWYQQVIVVPLIALPALFAACWLRAVWVMTTSSDPTGTGLWITTSALKIISLLSLPILLSFLYRRLYDNRRAAAAAMITWTLVSLLCLLLLSALRTPLTETLDAGGAVQYYSTANAPEWFEDHALWLVRWKHGVILLLEFTLAVALAATHTAIGFYLGDRPVGATVIAVAATLGVLIIYSLVFQLWEIDWDNFHRDIFSGALCIDLMIPIVAVDPYTTIASLVYFGIVLPVPLILRFATDDIRACEPKVHSA